MATIEEGMPRVAAGELHEDKRLMYPPTIVDVSLVGRNGVKILPQHATRTGIVPRQRYNIHRVPSQVLSGALATCTSLA